MGEFKVNYYLQKVSKETKTYHFILVSVAWNNKRVRTTLKINIDTNLWDEKKQRAKASSKNPRLINDKLDEIRQVLKVLYDETEGELKRVPTVKEVKNVLDAVVKNKEIKKRTQKNDKELLFLEAFEEFIKDTESGKRLSNDGKRILHSTITSYYTTRNHIVEMMKPNKIKKLTFNDIDENFFSNLVEYLSNKLISNNSQGRLIKIVKTFMHYGLEKGLHTNHKFIKNLKVFNEETTHVALNEAELESIENLQDLSLKLQKVRTMLLLQCYSGLRYSDLMNLKKENIDYKERIITIYTIKTKEPLKIPMTSKLEAIVKDFISLKTAISAQKYNDYIKDLCLLAGIVTPIQLTHYIGNKRVDTVLEKYKIISSHTGRRTFVTLSIKKAIPEDIIMLVTGHKSKSSFQRYVRITKQEALNTLRSAWE